MPANRATENCAILSHRAWRGVTISQQNEIEFDSGGFGANSSASTGSLIRGTMDTDRSDSLMEIPIEKIQDGSERMTSVVLTYKSVLSSGIHHDFEGLSHILKFAK